jgi:hypothetical protein
VVSASPRGGGSRLLIILRKSLAQPESVKAGTTRNRKWPISIFRLSKKKMRLLSNIDTITSLGTNLGLTLPCNIQPYVCFTGGQQARRHFKEKVAEKSRLKDIACKEL